MRVNDSGSHRSLETPSTSCTPTMSSPTHAPPSSALTTSSSATTTVPEIDPDTTDLSCPHCPRTFTSHIGLVGYLRIHRTDTDEPVPGTPTYTRPIRLNCPHCTRTFVHRMGLLGHMRLHENWQWTTAGYTTPPHLSPPASLKIITHHKHPTAASHACWKCASRHRLHAAHLLHV
ncbi:hypothetical protein SprV_0902755700 [Sparganum proliferum]